jgi:hypothetical protein
MTHTVEFLADHKGNTAPKVVGDEYMVRAKINLTAYRDAAVTSTVNLVNSAETITYASGTALTQPVVGRHITIGSAATGGNDGVKLVTASSATVITVEANGITADATNDEITITPTYELLTASELGLSSVTSVKPIAQESTLHLFTEILGTSGTGTLLDKSTFELGATVMSTGANAAVSDLGYVILEVRGNI